jgi:VWFA-related protein
MSSSALPATRAGLIARCLAGALAAALGAIALAAGQQPPPKPPAPPAQPQAGEQQVPLFRAAANFVRVDVYPTAGGKPVTDLRQEDFEVFEDGVPQEIRTFEHVVVAAPTAEEVAAREPRTIEESRQMAAESRARLFVLYLDTYHISRGGAMTVRDALVRFLRRALGPDDMIAVTTPELPASTLTFGRRTESIESLVDRFYQWSRRDSIVDYDPIEQQYMECYPPSPGETGAVSAIAREMIRRRRERVTLESLDALVRHLGGIREERKAVLAVSEGWMLYGQNRALAQVTTGQSFYPGRMQASCDTDRVILATEDHQRDFQNIIDDANRANVSFYPLDPRGLAVFDQSLSEGPVDVVTDAAYLRARLDSLQTLASGTDGLAIVNSNDIDRGLRRVVDDLTSYYLLGYYSTNAKLDGKFRSIKVRVKRPGVDLRYRRGYRAATPGELAGRPEAAPSAGTAPSPVTGALGALARVRADAVVHAQAGYTWLAEADGAVRPVLWLVGEWDPSVAARDEQWKAGAEVTVSVTAPDKTAIDTVKRTLTRETRAFDARVPVPAGQTAGDYVVRVTTKPAGSVLGSTEAIHVAVPKWPAAGATALGQPMLFRRGPFSGPGWVAVGDPRFRRQERLKLELAVSGPMTASRIQLLDRAGRPLAVPVAAAERDEAGAKIVSGELALAPLAAGDYLIETSIVNGDTTQKVLSAFRIVP